MQIPASGLLATAVATILLLGWGSTVWGQASGYVRSAEGGYVMTSEGQCVRSDAWSEDKAIPECDPALAARLEAERQAREEAERRAQEAEAVEPPPEPEPEPQPQPQPASSELVLSDPTGIFESGSSELTERGEQLVDSAVQEYDQYERVDAITVTGYTDSRGSEELNQELSQERAEAVKDYMIQRGVPAEVYRSGDAEGQALIEATGRGEANPIADNQFAAGRAQNRRVEIEIEGTKLPDAGRVRLATFSTDEVAAFASGSTELTDGGQAVADEAVAAFQTLETPSRVRVTAYADSVGNAANNQQLSEERAQSVADYLVSQGVPADLIETQGMGESLPFASNATEAGRDLNRRVEIDVEGVM